MTNPQNSLLKNENGSLVVDFLFAFTLIFSFVTIFMSLAITLSAVEMVQYLTFSGARAYFAAHLDVDSQRQMGFNQYDQLLDSEAYGFIKNGSWFELEAPFVGDVTDGVEELKGYQQPADDPNRFHGVVSFFTAKVLAASSPFFGSTDPEGDGSGNTFSTNIGSYLGREPTTEECERFTQLRYQAILDLSVEGGASYNSGPNPNAYKVMMDNGC